MPSSPDNPLIVGDEKKLLIKIFKGQGPLRPPLGPDGKGKPRYVQVDQAGQVVQGVCYVGKKAENAITGQSMRTMYIGAHPAIMESNTILKKRITLFPPPDPIDQPTSEDSVDPLDSSIPTSSSKGKGRAIPRRNNSSSSTAKPTTIPLESEYPFSFEFPKFCMDVDADGHVLNDGSEDEDQTQMSSSSYNPDAKRSAFVRKISSGLGSGGGSGSTSGGTGSRANGNGADSVPARRPSLLPFRTSSTSSPSAPGPPAASSSFVNSPSVLSRTLTSESAKNVASSSSPQTGSTGISIPSRSKTRRMSSTFSFSGGSSFAAMGGLLGRSPSSHGDGISGSPRSPTIPLSTPPTTTSSMSPQASSSLSERRESDVTVSAPPTSGLRRGSDRRPSLAMSVGSGNTVGAHTGPDPRGPGQKQRYYLPPSCNMLIGAVQTEIHYEIKFKLKRKGWRLNDTWIVRCMHFPKTRIPYERIPFQPRHPGWQTVRLPGGNAKEVHDRDKGKRRESDAATVKPGIMADIFVPSPLIVMIPRAAIQETAPPPSIPFRLHFSSNLPFPLLTFASTEASQWRISLVRETRLVLHTKEEVRYSVLRGTWSLARDPLSAFAVGSPNQVENIDLTRVHTGNLGLSSFREDEEVPAYDDLDPITPISPQSSNLMRLDTRDTTRSSEEANVFEQDLELEESSEGRASGTGSVAADRDVETSSAEEAFAQAASSPAPASVGFTRRLPMDDVFFADDDPEDVWNDRSAPPPRADSPPPGFDQTQYAPSLATMPPPPPPPPPAFRPIAAGSPRNEAPQMDTEEHVYLDGTLTLFRTAYKAVYQPFDTREVKIRYWLEVTVEPKSGAVAESFENIKGRVEAFVVRQGRTE